MPSQVIEIKEGDTNKLCLKGREYVKRAFWSLPSSPWEGIDVTDRIRDLEKHGQEIKATRGELGVDDPVEVDESGSRMSPYKLLSVEVEQPGMDFSG
mmetsp:Transcript_20890/g.36722  ORF Transcript_20890/g.36722 Transcript_20890/m.36722 type:complete len:97 (+) Transcript_20890:128-418(+)